MTACCMRSMPALRRRRRTVGLRSEHAAVQAAQPHHGPLCPHVLRRRRTERRRVTISGSQKNVLVGTLGAGGRGVFAIDITNPHPATETAAAANVLWEVNSGTSGSYSNLGYTYSTPVLANVNTGASAVILGNGYNSGGVSSLFVLDLKDGSVIKEVKTSGATGGGLSTPVCIDTNGDLPSTPATRAISTGNSGNSISATRAPTTGLRPSCTRPRRPRPSPRCRPSACTRTAATW